MEEGRRTISARRAMALTALAVLACATIAVLGPGRGSAAARSTGGLAVSSGISNCRVSFGPEPMEVAVIVKRRRVSCHTARSVVGYFMRHEPGNGVPALSYGWSCVWRPPGSDPGSMCTKGRRLIGFQTD